MTRAQRFFNLGKRDVELRITLHEQDRFEYHADWQNYLAGVRAAVL